MKHKRHTNLSQIPNDAVANPDTYQTDVHRNRRKRRKRPVKQAKDSESKKKNCSDNQLLKAYLVFQNMGELVGDSIASQSSSRHSAMPVLKLQKPAPIFEGTAVLHKNFVNISINDYKGQYLILFFYPLDFTFVCPTEIIAFSEKISEFNEIGCAIVGCSTDSQYSHLAWMNTDRKKGGIGDLNYPLLSDKNMSIARSYGVLDEDCGIPFRGLFIIDRNQNLRQIIVNDLPIGRSVDEALRLVRALQFHEANGNVCPINWRPGSKTIVPEPTASMEFFKSVA